MDPARLTALAKRWLSVDPDPSSRAELKALLDAQDHAALHERFVRRLEFGTAGLRGFRGAGPNRMNRLLVRIATVAYAQVLLERIPEAAGRGVVVGFDARHQSDVMARDACAVLAGMGVRVHFLATAQPTPLAAFAVLHLGAAGGIVLTASHNPPEYNGYKVFWANGAQIVPPIDSAIGAAMDAIELEQPLPWLALDAARECQLLSEYAEPLEEAYLQAIRRPSRSTGPAVNIVYTPLHGVAGALAVRALRRQGFSVDCVVEQFQPDGDFPSVAFPNPERPEALALACTRAQQRQAELILANDPDGDRLAVAVRRSDGRYEALTGDQIGWLLGDYILASYAEALPTEGFVVTTIVSSSLLDKIAGAYGVSCERTLTGLKWVWNRALELESAGGAFLFGYEEAMGYSVCPRVRDKDGISAATLFAELARACAAEGKTVLDRLDDIYRRVGIAATRQINIPLSGQRGARGRAIVDRLRRRPPVRLGALSVVAVNDWANRTRTDLASGVTTSLALPAGDVVQLELVQGGRVSIRPSGTEPLVKIYLESYRPVSGEPSLKDLKRIVSQTLDQLETAVTGWALGQDGK